MEDESDKNKSNPINDKDYLYYKYPPPRQTTIYKDIFSCRKQPKCNTSTRIYPKPNLFNHEPHGIAMLILGDLGGACRKIHKQVGEVGFEDAVARALKHAPNKKGGYRFKVIEIIHCQWF
ncbi:hypothetical protein GQR58_027737 [Nymphon striatum]|nr:hypothetical protein GQR58_027737 [Nymphon striatum]